MSLSTHAANMRAGTKMGDVKFIDTMIKDGLWDAFHGYHMGTTAENVATAVPDHAGGAGQVRGRLPEQGGGRPEGRPLQGRDRAGDGAAARATSWSRTTSTSGPGRPWTRSRS